jgi:hypothetical protein
MQPFICTCKYDVPSIRMLFFLVLFYYVSNYLYSISSIYCTTYIAQVVTKLLTCWNLQVTQMNVLLNSKKSWKCYAFLGDVYIGIWVDCSNLSP